MSESQNKEPGIADKAIDWVGEWLGKSPATIVSSLFILWWLVRGILKGFDDKHQTLMSTVADATQLLFLPFIQGTAQRIERGLNLKMDATLRNQGEDTDILNSEEWSQKAQEEKKEELE